MALMQLIHNINNVHFGVINNMDIEYITENFSDNRLILNKSPDTKCPEYLEIELNQNVNNFKQICHKVCLMMEIGGNMILNIPLRFMMNLKNYEICDDKLYISIPFQMFCDDIKLICLEHRDVVFTLINNEHNFTCKLISKCIYYDTPIRKIMSTTIHFNIVQYLTSIEFNCPNPQNEFKHKMHLKGIHKGFFIESENIDEINEITLHLNDHERTRYNRFMVRTKCVKINQHLLYFPLNIDKLYTDRTNEGFNGSLYNLESTLKIKFDNPQSKLCIYGLGLDKLMYDSGMVMLRMGYNQNHSYVEYDEVGK